jgi:hypothetical protein
MLKTAQNATAQKGAISLGAYCKFTVRQTDPTMRDRNRVLIRDSGTDFAAILIVECKEKMYTHDIII